MKNKIKLLGISLLAVFVLSGCASWDRFTKGLSSEFGNGLYREVKVVSQTGEILHQYEGKVDVEVNDYRVKYINEHGKLVIVYLGGSTAVVTEK